MRARTISTFVIAGLLLTSHAVLAQSGPRGPRGDGPRGNRWERMAEVLDLSEEQTTAIATIHDEARAGQLELRRQTLQLQNELDGEMLKDAPDQAVLDGLIDRMSALRAQIQKDRIATRLAVRQELTPEQRDRWLLMRERGSRRGGGDGSCRDRSEGRRGRAGRGTGRHG